MKIPAALLLFLALTLFAQQTRRPASQTEAMYQSAAASADRKFQHIEENGARSTPDQQPLVLTDREINAYIASGKVDLPDGVKGVRFTGRPGTVEATARVDFDEITAKARSSNPLLSLFSGVHDVHAIAKAEGSGGQGHAEIQSVDIDGTTVPKVALEYFISKYVTPKYPDVGMTSTFQLPDRIDTATVGQGTLTVTQK